MLLENTTRKNIRLRKKPLKLREKSQGEHIIRNEVQERAKHADHCFYSFNFRYRLDFLSGGLSFILGRSSRFNK